MMSLQDTVAAIHKVTDSFEQIIQILNTIEAQLEQQSTKPATNWIYDTTPNIPLNSYDEFIVTCVRSTSSTTSMNYVFAAMYLNEYLLYTDDDDCPEDGKPFTGWYFQTKNDPEYDTCFEPVLSATGDEILCWAYLPPGGKRQSND